MKYMIAHEGDVVHQAQIKINQSFSSSKENIEEFDDFDKWLNRLDELGVDTSEIEREKDIDRTQISVSRRQFFLGITFFEHNGSPLKRQIEALIDNLEDPQKTILKTEYQQASSFDRLNPSVLAIAEALEISEQTMDEFFDYCLNEKWG